jgi:hypothetical protein
VIKLNIKKDKYIILELIPTNLKSKNGIIIQLSALKINGLKLENRFDYRLNDNKLPIIEMKSIIDYDNEKFTYVDNEEDILNDFKIFCEDYPIIIIDNIYTKEFLDIDNKIEYIYNYLNMSYSKDLIEQIISKYNLEPSNHIVDLLYEALMMEY